MSIKLHHALKDVKVDKLEIKQLNKNLNFVREEWLKLREELKEIEKLREVLKDKVTEIEVKVELLEDFLEDLKEYKDRYDEEQSKVLHKNYN